MKGGRFSDDVINDINLNDTNINQYIIENIPYDDNKENFIFKFSNDNTHLLSHHILSHFP